MNASTKLLDYLLLFSVTHTAYIMMIMTICSIVPCSCAGEILDARYIYFHFLREREGIAFHAVMYPHSYMNSLVRREGKSQALNCF